MGKIKFSPYLIRLFIRWTLFSDSRQPSNRRLVVITFLSFSHSDGNRVISSRCNCLPANREPSIRNSQSFFFKMFTEVYVQQFNVIHNPLAPRSPVPDGRSGDERIVGNTPCAPHTRRRCFIRPPHPGDDIRDHRSFRFIEQTAHRRFCGKSRMQIRLGGGRSSRPLNACDFSCLSTE